MEEQEKATLVKNAQDLMQFRQNKGRETDPASALSQIFTVKGRDQIRDLAHFIGDFRLAPHINDIFMDLPNERRSDMVLGFADVFIGCTSFYLHESMKILQPSAHWTIADFKERFDNCLIGTPFPTSSNEYFTKATKVGLFDPNTIFEQAELLRKQFSFNGHLRSIYETEDGITRDLFQGLDVNHFLVDYIGGGYLLVIDQILARGRLIEECFANMDNAPNKISNVSSEPDLSVFKTFINSLEF